MLLLTGSTLESARTSRTPCNICKHRDLARRDAAAWRFGSSSHRAASLPSARQGGLPGDRSRIPHRVESGLLRIGLNARRWRHRVSAQARWETLGRLPRKVTR